MSPIPKLGITRTGFTPYVAIYNSAKLTSVNLPPIWDFQAERKFLPEDEEISIQCNATDLAGDLLLEFSHTSFSDYTPQHITVFFF
jgi:hypothetical protein